MQPIVITDVDGILVRPEDGLDASAGTARALAAPRVPVVLWSSKSRAEIEAVRAQFALHAPFFVENGSALFLPTGYFRVHSRLPFAIGAQGLIEFGCLREHVVRVLNQIALSLGIVVDCRSVPERAYDQPFHITEGSTAMRLRLARSMRRASLHWTRSDEGDHANGVLDPGVGLSLLRILFESASTSPTVLIGLGRANNHLSLLQEVDIPLIVPHETAIVTERLARRVRNARLIPVGTDGWRAVAGILAGLKLSESARLGAPH